MQFFYCFCIPHTESEQGVISNATAKGVPGLLTNMKANTVDKTVARCTTPWDSQSTVHSKDLCIQESFWSILHCNSDLLKSSLYQHRNTSLPTDNCSNGKVLAKKGLAFVQRKQCNMDNRQPSCSSSF